MATDARKLGDLADALWGTLQSPNCSDSNCEPANIVDALYRLARAIDRHAEATKALADASRTPPAPVPERR